MSSGEKAKPPKTFEERNPFDISRRSGPEVAAEIAKRMAAWKQARSRTSGPTSTIPSADAKAADDIAISPAIAAPVQPARMPKPSAPATPAGRGAGNSTLRVPFFASASATRRAMPPAPSLKQGTARSPAGDELAERADEPAIQIAAPVLEQESARHAEATAKPETPLTDATPVAPLVTESATPEPEIASAAPAVEIPDPAESPLAAKTPRPDSVETEGDERRRAEARAIKARWIAACDLDEMIDTSGRTPTVEAAAAATGEATSDKVREPQATAGDLNGPLPDDKADEAASREELLPEHDADLGAEAEVQERVAARETATATQVQIAVPEQAAGHLEPPVDADSDAAKEAPALDLAALDEMAGRREPMFDAPLTQAASETADATPSISARDEAAIAATEPAPVADGALSIAALDEVAGRREPTFDEPVQRNALRAEVPPPAVVESPAAATAKSHADAPNATSAVAPTDRPAVGDPSHLDIAALDEAAGRKEPTFDEPVQVATPVAAPTPASHIKLRPIETRIEARRVDTLRADPQLSVRRQIFPRIEPDEWDVPPVVAARANRERRGTSWAIGLGTVLLLAGITAPAAIWQQGRQGQDQAALVSPQPAQQQASAPVDTTAAQQQPQATQPEAPQPETPAPAVAAQDSDVPSVPAGAAPNPEAETAPKPGTEQAAAQPASTLGPINNGASVNEAPVMTPPPPMVSLASKADPSASSGTSAPMVARPFVPQDGNGPFLRAPTTGAASVPVAGAPAQSAAVGVKPGLMVQLKPTATAKVSAAKPAATPRSASRKPKPFFQQSPEQMFNTLIETLSEGKPVNPATKPASPSHRR